MPTGQTKRLVMAFVLLGLGSYWCDREGRGQMELLVIAIAVAGHWLGRRIVVEHRETKDKGSPKKVLAR